MQVCPTDTPGPPPVGITEYLAESNTPQVAVSAKSKNRWLQCNTPGVSGGGGDERLYHIPSLGLSSGSRTGRNSIAVDKCVTFSLVLDVCICK